MAAAKSLVACPGQGINVQYSCPIISGTSFRYLDEGAYAVVFFDPASKRVRKVMKATTLGNEHIAKVFAAEVEAMEIASNSSALARFIPQYFGISPGGNIVGGNGQDISTHFFIDLSFEAEFIPGTFEKLSYPRQEQVVRVLQEFKSYGIRHLEDASAVFEDGAVKKIIDIAPHYEEPFWPDCNFPSGL